MFTLLTTKALFSKVCKHMPNVSQRLRTCLKLSMYLQYLGESGHKGVNADC